MAGTSSQQRSPSLPTGGGAGEFDEVLAACAGEVVEKRRAKTQRLLAEFEEMSMGFIDDGWNEAVNWFSWTTAEILGHAKPKKR
jgi:hypothetical protein